MYTSHHPVCVQRVQRVRPRFVFWVKAAVALKNNGNKRGAGRHACWHKVAMVTAVTFRRMSCRICTPNCCCRRVLYVHLHPCPCAFLLGVALPSKLCAPVTSIRPPVSWIPALCFHPKRPFPSLSLSSLNFRFNVMLLQQSKKLSSPKSFVACFE